MTSGDLHDVPGQRPVLRQVLRHRGAKWDVATDTVELSPGLAVDRDVVRHPGAVAVVAVRDDEVLLVHQYRHPVAATLWELPAGLLDEPDEPAVVCAQRELAEEADLTAQRWDVLVDVLTSAGMSDEACRVFLAREVSSIPADRRHRREHEEAEMSSRWVPLDEALRAVADGRIQNALTVAGLLAADRARAAGWRELRPADAPWPQRRTGSVPGTRAPGTPG